jgi:hypothetical protein
MSPDTVISTSCPQCGEVDLSPEQMWVVLAEPVDRSHYGFRCPGCATSSLHPADVATLALLAGLVPVETMLVPLEALEEASGPALTSDDLIDLMVALESHDLVCETC